MLKRFIYIFIISFIFTVHIFTQENNRYSIEIDFTAKPYLDDGDLPRGINLQWNKYITESLYWGLSSRIINDSFTSASVSITYDFKLYNLYLPIEIGTGVKISRLFFDIEDEKDFNSFISLKSGIEWQFDPNWKYSITGTYNYNYLNTPRNIFYVNLGIIYNF